MTLMNMAKFLWLLCMIFSVSASDQYFLSTDYKPSNSSYICADSTSLKPPLSPLCCPSCNCTGCLGLESLAIEATNATEILGVIDVIHDGASTAVKALADLNTRRNFITWTLIDDLNLGGEIQKLSDVDIHSIDISGRNVTIANFVLLSIGISIDKKVITDKIFEIIPGQESNDSNLKTPDLILGLSFLNDAGALGINQALFTAQKKVPCPD